MSGRGARAVRVAVVGNSRDVLARDNGAEVDRCDLVVRINSFRTRGVERATGARTDIVSICLAPWVVAHALAGARETLRRVPAVWTPSWRGHADDGEVAQAMRALGRPVGDLVFSDASGHAGAMQALYRAFSARARARPGEKTAAPDGRCALPTTGFLTVHLARLRFPQAKICLTGFGLDSALDLRRFDTSGVGMWPGHDIATERDWLLCGAARGVWTLL